MQTREGIFVSVTASKLSDSEFCRMASYAGDTMIFGMNEYPLPEWICGSMLEWYLTRNLSYTRSFRYWVSVMVFERFLRTVVPGENRDKQKSPNFHPSSSRS